MGQWIRNGQLRWKGMRHVSPSASSRARRRGGGARIVASCGRPRESVVASSRDAARAFCTTCRNGMPFLLRHILRHVSFQRPFLLRHVPHMPRATRRHNGNRGTRRVRAPAELPHRPPPPRAAHEGARLPRTLGRVPDAARPRRASRSAARAPCPRSAGRRSAPRARGREISRERKKERWPVRSCVVVANTRRRSRGAALGPTLL